MNGPDGKPLTIAIETATGVLRARVWRVEVGRTTLLLLDSNLPENSESDRALTARLYGGDARVRIRQELLLGVGGVRALHALDIHPSVLHLNEGHSAFATIEMIRAVMESTGAALRRGDAGGGRDDRLHHPHAGRRRARSLPRRPGRGAPRQGPRRAAPLVRGLHGAGPGEPRRSERAVLHDGAGTEAVALRQRRQRPARRGLAEDVAAALTRTSPRRTCRSATSPTASTCRPGWPPRWPCCSIGTWGWTGPGTSGSPETWEGIETVDDAELWETQQVLKARLINFVRNRLVAQARRRNEPDAAVQKAMDALDLNALTIGFARRFATYKRAGLILQDVERLTDLVKATDRPVQIIFAGKAHPEDRMGKELIQGIVRITRQDRFFNRIVFVEDYDMNVARSLVQGVDVWLNNPRRPQEASGTSGQKAVLNGTLNFSVLDGWWAEAYDGTNGFAIGIGRTHAVPSVQDERDHKSLLETLTNEVVPLYYQRDASGLPREWIARQKNAFRTLAWRFNADRMVMDYARRSYLPAAGGLSCAMPRG